MKGCRKCQLELGDDDSKCYMSEVNKGAQKIMTEVPDQLTSLFKWTVLTGVFIFLLVIVTYVVLRFESPNGRLTLSFEDELTSMASELRAQEPTVVNVTSREFCSSVAKTLYSLEQVGYVDTDHRVSKLMALEVSAGDVHYVFMNSTHVPWLFTCSLESALRAAVNNSRVNVFVVYGVEFESPPSDGKQMVSLSSTLEDLVASYGDDRLRVVHVNLEECLECSPFQGMDLNRRPALANFVVQLVLLWQFGGTVLDPSVVSVREEVYRASGSAVEYGHRIISSPVACHSFVYDAMLYTRNYAIRKIPFGQETIRRIVNRTIRLTGRTGQNKDIRPMAEGIVCRDGAVGGHCYYVEAVTSDTNSYVRGFCPVISEATLPWFKKTTDTTNHIRDTMVTGA